MGTLVYTGGTFDLLHKGHMELLEACARMGRVVVALNTDEFVTEFKGAPPFQPYEDRALMLRACRYVTGVVPNTGGADSREAIDSVRRMDGLWLPGDKMVIAVGSDWAPPRDYYGQMGFTADWLDKEGLALVYVDRRTGESTTAIKERLCDG